MAESKKKSAGKPTAKSSAKEVPAKKPVAKPAAKAVAKAPAKPEPVKAPAKKVVAPVAKAPVKAAPIATSVKAAPAKVVAAPVAKTIAKPATKPAAKPAAKVVTGDTHSFGPEYLVLMQKDPNWMQAFWDVNDRRVNEAVKGGRKLVLRLYDISTDLTVRAHRNRKFRDFEVPADARSWYIQNGSTSGQYAVSLGSVNASGDFAPLMDSSKVSAFGSDGQFLGEGDDLFLRASLGGVGPGGFGSSQLGLSSQLMLPWTSSLAGSSEAGSSWGSSVSGASWNQPAWQNLGKDFFLWVKTRLIVYGGTRPDAHLQVRGEHFPLNPDGTFSFEQDLPDSTQIIPVFATDKDGDFPTTIVPIVIKRTE